MEAEIAVISLGYNELSFADIVDKELKNNNITKEELEYLHQNHEAWKAELIGCKRRIEMQFTSSKTRSFTYYKDFFSKQIDHSEYLNKIHEEKIKKVNASRFLQQIETRLQELKLQYG